METRRDNVEVQLPPMMKRHTESVEKAEAVHTQLKTSIAAVESFDKHVEEAMVVKSRVNRHADRLKSLEGDATTRKRPTRSIRRRQRSAKHGLKECETLGVLQARRAQAGGRGRHAERGGGSGDWRLEVNI